MSTKIYQNQVVKYIYQEGTSKEKKEFEKLLSSNSELQDEFFELLAAKHDLDDLKLKPSDKVINKILDFSKSINVESIP